MANSSTYDSFIHTNLPVYPGAQEKQHETAARSLSASPDTSGLLTRLKARNSNARTDTRNSGSSGAPFATSASSHASSSSHASASPASENTLSSIDVSADDDSFRSA